MAPVQGVPVGLPHPASSPLLLFNGIPSLALHALRDARDHVTDFVDSVVFLIETTWEVFDEPVVLSDLSPSDFLWNLVQEILDLSLDDLQVDLGDGIDRLQAYVEDVIVDLSKNRLTVRKKTERKNGLSYTERWVLLPTDAEIPGESSTGSPEMAGVHG